MRIVGRARYTMADTTVDATRRLNVKKQTLDDAYAAPANFLEIDVINPETHGVGKKRYTDYEVRMRVSPRESCSTLAHDSALQGGVDGRSVTSSIKKYVEYLFLIIKFFFIHFFSIFQKMYVYV